ncbi:MAG: ComF family protein [Clostridia bacterium]|nr:ComF family protein [Clostridia bacterium]
MSVLERLLKAIYPDRCPCCRQLKGIDEPCDDCAVVLKKQEISGKVCRRCGLEKRFCCCSQYHYLFEGVAAPFYNRDLAKDGVYGIKYKEAPFAAKYFGKRTAESFIKRFPDVKPDFVCCVPCYSKEARKKNYDAVEQLAKAVADELDLPLKLKALKKVRATEKQHTLPQDKRQANVKGAYKPTARFDGKTVLLIDDIKTTGYTLNECSKQLRMAGAEKVYCATALMTSKRQENALVKTR